VAVSFLEDMLEVLKERRMKGCHQMSSFFSGNEGVRSSWGRERQDA
jgi:hypothetical protein